MNMWIGNSLSFAKVINWLIQKYFTIFRCSLQNVTPKTAKTVYGAKWKCAHVQRTSITSFVNAMTHAKSIANSTIVKRMECTITIQIVHQSVCADSKYSFQTDVGNLRLSHAFTLAFNWYLVPLGNVNDHLTWLKAQNYTKPKTIYRKFSAFERIECEQTEEVKHQRYAFLNFRVIQ